jgi:hypothetical protein
LAVGSSFAEEAAEWPLATGANRTGVMTIADGLNVTAFAKIAIWPNEISFRLCSKLNNVDAEFLPRPARTT